MVPSQAVEPWGECLCAAATDTLGLGGRSAELTLRACLAIVGLLVCSTRVKDCSAQKQKVLIFGNS